MPSLVPVWRGAQLQEREIYDLMGIRFEGHPDLRRVFLWDGFPGHPAAQGLGWACPAAATPAWQVPARGLEGTLRR